MNILGVSNAWDSGAALLVDGLVVAAANEERFSRIKLERCFPIRSIEYVLEHGELSVQDLDQIAVGGWKGLDENETLPNLVDEIGRQVLATNGAALGTIRERLVVSASRDRLFKEEIYRGLSDLGVDPSLICFYDHHLTHAASAYCPSPFDNALVLTVDGRGDYRSVALWRPTEAGLSLVDMTSELVSPGAMYGFVTKYLGFVPDRHEGKVTGLAAYGRMTEAYDLLEAGFSFDHLTGRLSSCIGVSYSPFVSADLEVLAHGLDAFAKEDVAFAVQALFEDSLVSFLQHNIDSMDLESVNLCLAGGCVGNVKLNYEFRQIPQVNNVYVFPHMGDGGLSLGAAMAARMECSGESKSLMPTAYLGPEYSDDQIEEALVGSGLRFSKYEKNKIPAITADALSKNRIVGWFQGRMEVGPRALGSRSILASATDKSINTTLNQRLDRTDFMPFAPATIDTIAADCFIGWTPNDVASQFMTMCYDCTPFLAEKCPAVVHVDNTARPQVVFRAHNPDFYDVIEAYIDMTGNPSIINTSFNHHEEPIVMTPNDAIRSCINGDIDLLVAGRWIVEPS